MKRVNLNLKWNIHVGDGNDGDYNATDFNNIHIDSLQTKNNANFSIISEINELSMRNGALIFLYLVK